MRGCGSIPAMIGPISLWPSSIAIEVWSTRSWRSSAIGQQPNPIQPPLPSIWPSALQRQGLEALNALVALKTTAARAGRIGVRAPLYRQFGLADDEESALSSWVKTAPAIPRPTAVSPPLQPGGAASRNPPRPWNDSSKSNPATSRHSPASQPCIPRWGDSKTPRPNTWPPSSWPRTCPDSTCNSEKRTASQAKSLSPFRPIVVIDTTPAAPMPKRPDAQSIA